jgi:regulator of sirC expression with transglutaminase-like and TPR domain
MTPKAALRAIEARRLFIAEAAGLALPRSLTRAALAVAGEDFGSNVDAYVARLDLWSNLLRKRLSSDDKPRVSVVNRFVFEELGFRGNFENYHDPRNSFLSYVVDERKGIPLTLSLVYIDVAVSAGIEAYGIGMPGHFLVGVNEQGQTTLVDCFNGKTVDEDECRERLDEIFEGRIELAPQHLRRSPARQILSRLLLNLKAAYVRCELFKHAIAVSERILVLEPGNWAESLDRARFKARSGKYSEALAGFEGCIRHTSDEDAKLEIRNEMKDLIKRMAELN